MNGARASTAAARISSSPVTQRKITSGTSHLLPLSLRHSAAENSPIEGIAFAQHDQPPSHLSPFS